MLAVEQEASRVAAEEEAARLAVEEAQRVAAEEEAARVAAEQLAAEEAARQAEEDDGPTADAPWREAGGVDTAALLRELSSLGGFNDDTTTPATPAPASPRPAKPSSKGSGKPEKKKKGLFGR